MANLEHQGVVAQRAHQFLKVGPVCLLVSEGPRKLQQEGAQLRCRRERLDGLAKQINIFLAIFPLVSELLPYFGGESEIGVCLDAPGPFRGRLRRWRIIKGTVDFYRIKILRRKGEWVKCFSLLSRVENSLPITVDPASP